MSATIITMEEFKTAAQQAELAARFVRRPVSVQVLWSESDAWAADQLLSFGEFEAQALAVAMVRIPVKLNSDSGICEHHFRKVCGQGFFEQKLSFEGRHLFDSLNKPAAKRSAAVVDPRRWNRTVHLTSEYVH